MNSGPTLDALAARPELARALTHDVAFELQLKALSVAMICGSALVASGRASDTALAAALTTEEAARLLGIAPSTLRHGARTTYKSLRIENGTRRQAWSRPKVEAFMRRAS